MGKINGCLKCLFIFFNVVFAILGCLFVVAGIQASTYNHQLSAVGGPSTVWTWVFAIAVLGISCLGIFAACSEKTLALKIFAGFMGVGMVIMLIFGIIVVVTRNKIREHLQNPDDVLVKTLMSDQEIRAMLEGLQTSMHCCGVTSAADWEEDIPDSCRCESSDRGLALIVGGGQCKGRPLGTTGPDLIYSEPCSNIILFYVDVVFNIVLGFFFGLAVIALLGLLISLLMIHQVKRHEHPGAISMDMKGY